MVGKILGGKRGCGHVGVIDKSFDMNWDFGGSALSIAS